MSKDYSHQICHWPVADRPRERLAKYGEHTLSHSELLAILLRTGCRGTSALDLARAILRKFNTFRQMSHRDASQWVEFKGLGPAKIAQIKAAIEIGRRMVEDERQPLRKKVHKAEDVVSMVMPRMRDLKIEIFKVVYLNTANEIIEIRDEAQGTVNFATPIIREIMHRALQCFAAAIICVHNHPSGQIIPSREDKDFTRKITEAGRVMQINVLDHVIIGDNEVYSILNSQKWACV